MRIFDALNDLDNVKESIKLINEMGGIADGAVCYTVDPKTEAPAEKKGFFAKLFGSKKVEEPEKIFTDEYFVEKAKGMEAYGAKIHHAEGYGRIGQPVARCVADFKDQGSR